MRTECFCKPGCVDGVVTGCFMSQDSLMTVLPAGSLSFYILLPEMLLSLTSSDMSNPAVCSISALKITHCCWIWESLACTIRLHLIVTGSPQGFILISTLGVLPCLINLNTYHVCIYIYIYRHEERRRNLEKPHIRYYIKQSFAKLLYENVHYLSISKWKNICQTSHVIVFCIWHACDSVCV